MPKIIRRTVSRTRLIKPATVIAPAPVVVQEVIVADAVQLPAPVVVQEVIVADAGQLPAVQILESHPSPDATAIVSGDRTITTVRTEQS